MNQAAHYIAACWISSVWINSSGRKHKFFCLLNSDITAWIFSYATSRILASRTVSIFIRAFASNDATPFSNANLNLPLSRERTLGPVQTQVESCDLMSLMMYHLLDCLYCNLHRKIFLPAWKIQHLNRLTKWDQQMCAACKMHVSGC